MVRPLDTKKKVRPRRFWLRGLAICYVLLMFEAALAASLMLNSTLAAQESLHEPEQLAARNDQPLMDYPHYRALMASGRANVYIDGRYRLFFKSDFTIEELYALGSIVRAE